MTREIMKRIPAIKAKIKRSHCLINFILYDVKDNFTNIHFHAVPVKNSRGSPGNFPELPLDIKS